MTKTANDVVRKALVYIRQLASDEAADGITLQDALDEYVSVHEQLVVDARHRYGARNINWSMDAVPAIMLPLVASILAVELIKPFPTSDKMTANVLAFERRAETKLAKRLQFGNSKQVRFPKFPLGNTLR